MYKSYSVCDEPDDTSKIWRYLDFSKFMSLIDSGELFFVRSENLQDRFEGFWSKTNLALDSWLKKYKSETYLSCWNLSEHESAILWDVYPKTMYGVAIQSNFGNFKQSFNDILERDVCSGKVKYTDFVLDTIPDNSLEPFLRKRKYFECDSELRVIIQKTNLNDPEIDPVITVVENGIYVPVFLDKLIEEIIISPSAPDFFCSLVQSIVAKYGLEKKVRKSVLSDVPVEEFCTVENHLNDVKVMPYVGVDSSGNITIVDNTPVVTDQKKP